MRKFKEGDELTLEDVKRSFREINNPKGLLKESIDLSRFPIDEDGARVFDSFEEYDAAYGGTVAFEETFYW